LRQFAKTFRLSNPIRILDLGGAPETWLALDRAIGVRPQVTMLNLHTSTLNAAPSWVAAAQGDARQLPYQPGDFDLIYCNSLIEHVGAWEDQQQCADEIRRLGCPYWVQTPNRYFPIEPHFLTIGVQFLPHGLARYQVKYLSGYGIAGQPSWAEVDAYLAEVRLLTVREMARLFPDSEIRRERVLGGLTKSIIAVGQGRASAHRAA
jgi:hypothetical protein